MRLIGLMLARNSEWIINASARAALMYCDGLVIFDHASTDTTAVIADSIAAGHPGRVSVIHESSPVWEEMDHRQRTLDAAREMGATHVANIDDDEIVTGNLVGRIGGEASLSRMLTGLRDEAEALRPGETMTLPWISMWGGLDSYRDDDSHWSRTQVDFIFALTPDAHYRRAADGYQHHSRRPKGMLAIAQAPYQDQNEGGLMHFQFASRRRLLAKQALYKLNEILRWPERASVEKINRLYDGTTRDEPRRMRQVPTEWWDRIAHLKPLINVDAEPWQEAEVRRLVAEHGAARFAGLDLYGVEAP